MTRPYESSRSLLFVPGGDSRKLARAPESGADLIILDLEDAVAPDQKDAARESVVRWIGTRPPAGSAAGSGLVVRINAAGTPWFEADLEAVVRAGGQGVMLPKCESTRGVDEVAVALDSLEREAGRPADGKTSILALVESAAGVTQAAAIAAAPRVTALCFGHVDFSLDMGLSQPDPARGVVHHARCAVAIAARASGVAPVDTVCLDVRSEAVFRAEAERGLELGFEGKLCIHPAQVAIANAVHTPTAEQVAVARRVMDGWRQARAAGRGVFSLDGKMVDAPVVAAHERILERARRAGVLDGA